MPASIRILYTSLTLFLGAGLVHVQPVRAVTQDLGSGELRSLGKCLDVLGGDGLEGTAVVLWECHGGDNQQWRFEGDGPLKRIVGTGDLCLSPDTTDLFGNTGMVLRQCDQGSTRWFLSGDFPRTMYLVHHDTGTCLDVRRSETENGTLTIPFECRGTANQTWHFVEQRRADSLPALLLPYFDVIAGFLAPFTDYAIRNDGDATIELQIDYYDEHDPLGEPSRRRVVTLAAKAVHPEHPGVFAPIGLRRGYIGLTALDPETGLPTAEQAISGDYFHFEHARPNATGDRLVNLQLGERDSTLCNRWQMRFLDGGTFSASTKYRIWVQNPTDGSEPVATGDVYDEDGEFLTTIEIYEERHAFQYHLPAVGTNAGSVEWTFAQGTKGFVFGDFRAARNSSNSVNLSVGMQATCLD